MSLGREGHLTQTPLRRSWAQVVLPCTRYQWRTLMDGWLALAWSLIAWQVVEVVVTSTPTLTRAWVCLDSHCQSRVLPVCRCSGRGRAPLELCLVDLLRPSPMSLIAHLV
jgi:hypothetical protein